MGKMENSGIWEQIQKSVQEPERLMGQKKYNLEEIIFPSGPFLFHDWEKENEHHESYIVHGQEAAIQQF